MYDNKRCVKRKENSNNKLCKSSEQMQTDFSYLEMPFMKYKSFFCKIYRSTTIRLLVIYQKILRFAVTKVIRLSLNLL